MKNMFRVLVMAFLIILIIPVVQAQEPLTETFTAADGSFSIMYPAGWFMREQDVFIQFSSRPFDLGTALVSGDMGITLYTNVFMADRGIVGDNIHDFVDNFNTALGSPVLDTVDFAVDDHSAARTLRNDPNEDRQIIGVDYGNGQMVILNGGTFKGELALLDQTMLAMLNSLQLTDTAFLPAAIPTAAPATVVPTTTISLQPALLWSVPISDAFLSDIAISPDDQVLAVSEFNRTSDVALLDAATGATLQTLSGNTNRVYRVAFSPDGSTVASTGSDGTLHLWDAATGAEKLVIQKDYQLRSMAFSPSGDSIAYMTYIQPNINTIWLLDVASGEDEIVFSRDTGDFSINELIFSPDGSTILFDASDYSTGFPVHAAVSQLDPATKEATNIFDQRAANPLNLFYVADGSLLAAVSPEADKTTQVWDVASNTLLYTLPEAHSKDDDSSIVATTRAVVNADGTILATGSINVEAQLWDAQTGAPLVTLDRNIETLGVTQPLGFAFSHDGQNLAVSYGPPMIALWNLTGAAAVTPAEETEAALPPIVTSTSTAGEYVASVSVPDNWSAKSLSLSIGAAIALLENGPNHIGGDVKFPATSGQASTPLEAASSFTNFITGTVTEFEVNGRPAARLDGTSSDHVVLYIVVTTSTGDLALISFYGPADAMAEEEATLLAIAATVTTGDPNSVPSVTEATPDPAATEPDTSAAATCTVTAPNNANLRSGSATTFEIAASLSAGETAEADGQTTGSDGNIWYRLVTGSWVRSDIITAAAECASLPSVSG